MAELEARKLKYATTGTEAHLMDIMTEGEDSLLPIVKFGFLAVLQSHKLILELCLLLELIVNLLTSGKSWGQFCDGEEGSLGY